MTTLADAYPEPLDTTLAYAASHAGADLPDPQWAVLIRAAQDARLGALRAALTAHPRTTPAEVLAFSAPLLGPGPASPYAHDQLKALLLREDVPLTARVPFTETTPARPEVLGTVAATSTDPGLRQALSGRPLPVALLLASNPSCGDDEALNYLRPVANTVVPRATFDPTEAQRDRLRELTTIWAYPDPHADTHPDMSSLLMAVRQWGVNAPAWVLVLPPLLRQAALHQIEDAAGTWVRLMLAQLRDVAGSLSSRDARAVARMLDDSGLTHAGVPAAADIGLPSTRPPAVDWLPQFRSPDEPRAYLMAQASTVLQHLATLSADGTDLAAIDTLVSLAGQAAGGRDIPDLPDLLVQVRALHGTTPPASQPLATPPQPPTGRAAT